MPGVLPITTGSPTTPIAGRSSSRSTTCRPAGSSPMPSSIARTDRLAGCAGGAGIGKGDRVALLAPNCAEYFELQFACGRLGAIMLPLNWRLTVPELDYILGDSTPKLLIHDKASPQQAHGAVEEPARDRSRATRPAPTSARWRRAPPAPAARAADARRHRHGDVHLGHHRPSEGRDHHPRHGVLERRQPRHPRADLAADRAARRSCRCSIPAASTATPTRCCMPAARS